MKKYVVVLLLLAGCGTGAPITPSRLDVTDELRFACGPVGLGDTQILSLLSAGEGDRLNGWTYQQQTDNILFNICPTAPNPAGCTDCLLAVTRQLYGY